MLKDDCCFFFFFLKKPEQAEIVAFNGLLVIYNIHFFLFYRRGDQTTPVNSCDAGQKNIERKPGGGGGGGIFRIRGGGVPPGSPNPDPISDQNMPFSILVFRPDIYAYKGLNNISPSLRLERQQQICKNSALMIYFGYFSFSLIH